MVFVVKENDVIAKSINRSKLVRVQKQVIRNGRPVTTYIWINPDKNKPKSKGHKMTDEELDNAYDALADIKATREVARKLQQLKVNLL